MCKTETICKMPQGTLLYSACCVENGVYDLEGIYKRATKRQNAPWGNSLYLAEKREVAERYVIDSKVAKLSRELPRKLVVFRLAKELPVICSNCEKYADGSCGTDDVPVIDEIETMLGKVETYFMTFLGSKGYAYRCYGDEEHHFELIMPSALIKEYLEIVEVIE